MNTRKILAFVLAAILVMSMAACGSSAPAATTAPATEAPATEAPATEAPATEAPTTEAPTEPSHYPVTIHTYMSTKDPIDVTFESCPQKVICTNQSQTELMLYFGLDEYIAGVAYLDGAIREDLQAQYDALVAAGKELTVKGYPSKEVVLAMEPDFIFGWRSAFVENALGEVTEWHDLGCGTMILRCSNNTVPAEERNLNAVLQDIADIGAIFDIEDKTDAYIANANELLAKVDEKVSSLEAPLSVVVIEPMGEGSWYCWGGSTLTGSLTVAAGGVYALPDGGDLSVEDLINLNPDVIIVDYMEEEGVETAVCAQNAIDTVAAVPALAEITAVANGKIMAVNLTDVYGGGVRMVPSVEAMFNFMYGEN